MTTKEVNGTKRYIQCEYSVGVQKSLLGNAESKIKKAKEKLQHR
jgi:hypothetical protein